MYMSRDHWPSELLKQSLTDYNIPIIIVYLPTCCSHKGQQWVFLLLSYETSSNRNKSPFSLNINIIIILFRGRVTNDHKPKLKFGKNKKWMFK